MLHLTERDNFTLSHDTTHAISQFSSLQIVQSKFFENIYSRCIYKAPSLWRTEKYFISFSIDYINKLALKSSHIILQMYFTYENEPVTRGFIYKIGFYQCKKYTSQCLPSVVKPYRIQFVHAELTLNYDRNNKMIIHLNTLQIKRQSVLLQYYFVPWITNYKHNISWFCKRSFSFLIHTRCSRQKLFIVQSLIIIY